MTSLAWSQDALHEVQSCVKGWLLPDIARAVIAYIPAISTWEVFVSWLKAVTASNKKETYHMHMSYEERHVVVCVPRSEIGSHTSEAQVLSWLQGCVRVDNKDSKVVQTRGEVCVGLGNVPLQDFLILPHPYLRLNADVASACQDALERCVVAKDNTVRRAILCAEYDEFGLGVELRVLFVEHSELPSHVLCFAVLGIIAEINYEVSLLAYSPFPSVG